MLATLTEAEIKKKLSRKRKAPSQHQPIHWKLSRKSDNVVENTLPGKDSFENDIVLENTEIENVVEAEPLNEDAATQTSSLLLLSNSTQTDLIPTLIEASQTEPDKLAISGRIQNVIKKNEINFIKSQ